MDPYNNWKSGRLRYKVGSYNYINIMLSIPLIIQEEVQHFKVEYLDVT